MFGSATNFSGGIPYNAMPPNNPQLNNFAFMQQQQQQQQQQHMLSALQQQQQQPQQPPQQPQQDKIPEPLASAYKRQQDGPILWFAGPPLNITESKPIHSTAYLNWRRAKHTN